MALFRLSRKSCAFLILFLVVNPLPGLLARRNPPSGNGGTYLWQNRGCRAVVNSIYNNVKIDADKLLVAFHGVTVDPTNKELHEGLHVVFDRVAEFVRANPDKVAGAGSIVAVLASACLLYDSILLTHGIMVFFDKFEELRGKFNAFVNTKLPKIEKLLIETRQQIETGNVPDDKELRWIESVLLDYYKEITDVLDKVRDLIEEAIVAEWDAKFTAAVAFTVAAAAGIALSPAVAVPVKGLVFKVGMGTAACLGTAAGVLSLRNAADCKLAQREMREFKKKVEDLKEQVWDWMLDIRMH